MSRIKIDYRTKFDESIRLTQKLIRGMYRPDFARQVLCWRNMKRSAKGEDYDDEWILDLGYCLDRTEAQ